MEPQDVIWRVLERVREAQEAFAEGAAQLHPERDRALVDTLFECERLSQTQLNLLRRAQRHYDRSRG